MTTEVSLSIDDQGDRSLALELPAGDDGIDATAMVMRAVAEHAARSSARVQQLSREVGRQTDYVPNRWFGWCKEHVKFKRDPWKIERVPHPEKLLRQLDAGGQIEGDCDDLATLTAAVLLASNYGASLVVMHRPGRSSFEHVLAATNARFRNGRPLPWRLADNETPLNFYPIDPQECDRPGIMPGPVGRFRVYPC